MIIRSEHADGFTVINNDVLRDARLSDAAHRLLVYMLSCSDDWTFSVEGLAFCLSWPVKKTKAAVTELKRCGYIEQIAQRGDHGHFLPCAWVIHETPQQSVCTGHPKHGRPVARETRDTGDPSDRRAVSRETREWVPLRNTNNKEIPKSKEIPKDKKEERDVFDDLLQPLTPELKQTFKDFLKMRKTLKAPMTVKALELAIKRVDKLGGGDPGKMKAIVEQSIMNSWKGLYELSDRSVPKRSKHAKWRTGAEAGLKTETETETRAPVSKLNDAQDIPNDILDLFGN